MTYSEIINPTDFFTNMKRDGSLEYHNQIAYESPNHNPTGWGEPKFNPDGKVPVLNPEHYIHPLSGRYTSGPLQF